MENKTKQRRTRNLATLNYCENKISHLAQQPSFKVSLVINLITNFLKNFKENMNNCGNLKINTVIPIIKQRKINLMLKCIL